MAKRKRLCKQALLKKILIAPAKELDTVCALANMNTVKGVVRQMIEVANAAGNCLGLAANQIGICKRVIIYRGSLEEGFEYMANPEIIEGKNSFTCPESCLSYPGRSKEVKAYDVIQVLHMDSTEEITGLAARVVQHEIKHLNGKCPVK